MAISLSKTKTSSVQRRAHLRVSARFARPNVGLIQPQRDASNRLKQLQKIERIQQLQSSERLKQSQSDTIVEAPTEPTKTTSKSTVETALSKSAPTNKQKMDNLIAKSLGRIPNEEEIATAATYYFVDVCNTYPASLIRFAAKVLIGHFEPILQRTTPTCQVYERLQAKTQFVKAMGALRAGMFPMPTLPRTAREVGSKK
ncbi:hypothetical protein N0V85_007438 [Neurospora sp. IMI 360204]|nr:hypothetical protein N0V85_007438 [Neurospora sp. IMI 360204]